MEIMEEKTNLDAQFSQSISNPYDMLDFDLKDTPRDISFQVIQTQQEEQFELEFDQTHNTDQNKEALSLQQKVFGKLLTDMDNQSCFDCGRVDIS